jgi:uncharacterized protein YndB with AHSA1/START domain
MSGKTTIKKDAAKREVTIEGILEGRQELVWRCLTTPTYIDQWWGPEGWATETKTMDARPGGTWHYRMHGHGTEVWGLADYEAVKKPHRIMYMESTSNAAGERHNSKQQVTINLISKDNERTAISINTKFESLADLETMVRMGMEKGYAGALDKLESVIKKEQHGVN